MMLHDSLLASHVLSLKLEKPSILLDCLQRQLLPERRLLVERPQELEEAPVLG